MNYSRALGNMRTKYKPKVIRRVRSVKGFQLSTPRDTVEGIFVVYQDSYIKTFCPDGPASS